MRFLKWTMPGGETANILIREGHSNNGGDYSPVTATMNQNSMRRILSALNRVRIHREPAYGDLSDLRLTVDQVDYRLWTYTRNWAGRSGFLYGVMVAELRRPSKNQRKRLRRKKKSKA